MTHRRGTQSGARPLRALVVTTSHVPQDARILHRQIAALRLHGWDVTYVAPWSASDQTPVGLATRSVPRAVGRRRARAALAARKHLRREARDHDLVLVHDLELVPVALSVRRARPLVWDVHEDNAASVGDRAWLPSLLRPMVRRIVGFAERYAARACAGLLLAERSYQTRFPSASTLVVENLPWRRAERQARRADPRAMYVGRLSAGRGLEALIAIGERLRGLVEVVLVGPVDANDHGTLAAAVAEGNVRWLGALPNDQALREIEGSTAGLSLLRDLPNYRGSMPTKVLEYMACGVPVITTPLPLAVQVVERSGCGHIVDFDDTDAAAAALLDVANDPERWEAMSSAGFEAVTRHLNWDDASKPFVSFLDDIAAGAAASPA